MLSILSNIYPFGVNSGLVISFIFKFDNNFLILLLSELSFTQPNFPPNWALSEILNVKAALSNPSLIIASLIEELTSSNFFFF